MTKTTTAARTLATNLAARSIAIKHIQALDLLAAGAGLANRHVLAQSPDMPVVKRVNRALLTSAATALALHDLDRRQVIIDETTKVVAPFDDAMIELGEYDLNILPAELDEDPVSFLNTNRGAALIEHLAADLYFEAYPTSQSDRPMSLAQGSELVSKVLAAKRDAEPGEEQVAANCAITEFFTPQDFNDYWWHEARRAVEAELEKINSDLADIDPDYGLDVDLWLDALEDFIGDKLCKDDTSSASDLFGRGDYCELVFILQPEGYVIDQMISSNRPWAAYDDLHVGPELQHALSRLGYSLEEYRLLSGNRNPGEDLRRGLRKRAERLVTPEELREMVENACAQYFSFALYAIVPVADAVALDPKQPITFTDQVAVATYNPFSGTFHDVIKKGSVTVTPKEGVLQTGADGVSPDDICSFYTPAFHTRIKNLVPTGSPAALAA